MLKGYILLLSSALLIILSSCKTTSRVENTSTTKQTETVYNRRESASLSVSSPTVNIVEELKRIGYVDMKVVSNKDTFKIKVTEKDITLDAVVSEKDFEVIKKEDIKEDSQVQVEVKQAGYNVSEKITYILWFISCFVIVVLLFKIFR